MHVCKQITYEPYCYAIPGCPRVYEPECQLSLDPTATGPCSKSTSDRPESVPTTHRYKHAPPHRFRWLTGYPRKTASDSKNQWHTSGNIVLTVGFTSLCCKKAITRLWARDVEVEVTTAYRVLKRSPRVNRKLSINQVEAEMSETLRCESSIFDIHCFIQHVTYFDPNVQQWHHSWRCSTSIVRIPSLAPRAQRQQALQGQVNN